MRDDIKIPDLIFVKKSYHDLLDEITTSESLVLSDKALVHSVPKKMNSVVIASNDYQQIDKIRVAHHFDKVIALGGCTCHDIARMVSGDKPYIIIPTILSTSCIGTDHAVISVNGRNEMHKVNPPEKVIISLKELLEKPKSLLFRWSASGVGDVLAGIGAATDVLFSEKKDLTYENLRKLVPTYFELLEWLLNDFETWDEASIKKLGEYEFHSSITSIKEGNSKLSAGGEHQFYDEILYRYPELRSDAGSSHGELVFLGLLIEMKLLALLTGDSTIYDQLKVVAKKLNLPITITDLEKINVTMEKIEKSLLAIMKDFPDSFMCKSLEDKDIHAFVSEIFSDH